MKVYKEITDLREHEPWGGAKYWHEKILEEDLGEEFIQFIEDVLPEGISETGLNDILWFDDEFITDFFEIHNIYFTEENGNEKA